MALLRKVPKLGIYIKEMEIKMTFLVGYHLVILVAEFSSSGKEKDVVQRNSSSFFAAL